jgi:anti-sigma factor RsiW
MKCEEIVQYLSDYIDGELPVEILVEAEQHMAGCPNCTTAAKTLKNTIQLYQHTGKARIAPEHRASLLTAIQEAAKTHSHE